jgi:hypothetical protein
MNHAYFLVFFMSSIFPIRYARKVESFLLLNLIFICLFIKSKILKEINGDVSSCYSGGGVSGGVTITLSGKASCTSPVNAYCSV